MAVWDRTFLAALCLSRRLGLLVLWHNNATRFLLLSSAVQPYSSAPANN